MTAVGDEALVVQALRFGSLGATAKTRALPQEPAAILKSAVTEYRRLERKGALREGGNGKFIYVEHHDADIDLTQKHFAEAAAYISLKWSFRREALANTN